MPIEMPRGLRFSVDTWTPSSSRKRHHFLTHAHRDHIQGLAPSRSFYPIYATHVTKILTLRHLPQQVDGEAFKEIEVGETVLVSDPDGDFSVTAFDANHCPGAVMFLFEGEFGSLLHTGDCRLSPDCLQKLPLKYITKKGSETCLDYLFLDCTFGRSSINIPSKEQAVQQVINCIWKHPNAPVVYLACDLLGQEEVLIEVSRTFGSKIYVDKIKCAECFQALLLIAPEILSEDASSRFQVFEGFPRLYERASVKLAEARANIQPEPLFIRPSAQWYACDDRAEKVQEGLGLSEAIRDEFGVWHVCYSMHSSQQELEWALQLLRPKWVISTTPPCRAMELEYVKNHCFKSQLTSEDPILKLFGVGARKSASSLASLVSEVAVSCVSSSIVEEAATSGEESNQLQVQKRSLLWDMPLPTTERPLTLFGRARFGPQDSIILRDEKIITSSTSNAEPSSTSSSRGGAIVEVVQTQEATVTEQVQSFREDSVSDLHFERSKSREPEEKRDAPYVQIISANISDVETSSSSSFLEDTIAEVRQFQEATVTEQVRSFHVDNVSGMYSRRAEGRELEVKRDAPCVGSSSVYNDNLRRLYRSMNVPVPRPLPSLVELMKTSKRTKIGL